MHTNIKTYLREIQSALATGNATEHTYRPAFKKLVDSLDKNIVATNEPTRVKCGSPDFIVDRENLPVGYIECKNIALPLDDVEKTDQLKRYFSSLENLILTDYLEFRYYIAGQQVIHVKLARINDKGKIKLMQGADEQLVAMFEAFFTAKPVAINTPKELASRMANIAKVIRNAIEKAFSTEGDTGTLHAEYESFRVTILGDITPIKFADMYAQTVCYGMFSARANISDHDAENFSRQHAAYDLPRTNPFLREIFDYIAGTKLDTNIVWAVDLLAEMLRCCEMNAILKDFGKATRQEDPVVHFYESFLAAYDPKMRKSRGVYYTPEPVVSFIVRSIDTVLKRDFACPDGLADNSKVAASFTDLTKKNGKARKQVHRVQILDPAIGTGTFLYETIRYIYDSMGDNRGSWAGEHGYVAQHLLPRLFGFELMMAPYAVAHLKLGLLLKKSGYDFTNNERLRVYLTNTLQESEVVAGPLLAMANQIAMEANAAVTVKTESPIMVIMGNPPYSGHSMNKNKWIDNLLKKPLPNGGSQSYFDCDGAPLGERNPKWLNDDYVKFIRFAQYRIELTGYGALGFITNHGYLDNPTFRGMRQSLMQTFDEIYILDLHGNSKKKELAPDGGADKNVFDIQQGVSIGLFVKKKNGKKKMPAKLFHADLWGRQAEKYDWLNIHDIKSTHWQKIKPQAPFYLFIPQDKKCLAEYQDGWSLTEMMKINSVGIITARDTLAIHYSNEQVWRTVKKFVSMPAEEAREYYHLGQDTRDWQVHLAQEDLMSTEMDEESIRPILYRPFDTRFTYYTGNSRGFLCMPRQEVMMNMLAGSNLGLISARSNKSQDMDHFFCTRNIMEAKCGERTTQSCLFPLYLYPEPGKMLESSPWPAGTDGRRPNLASDFVEDFAGKLGLEFVTDGQGDLKKTFGPEDVFYYTYAIFQSPTYRSRYAEFLKIDFPRLPLTSDTVLFAKLVQLGYQLTSLHLLENIPTPQTTYPQIGSNTVERNGNKGNQLYKSATDQTPGRVYINDSQYFDNVSQEIWDYRVGGYQPCAKWLKDRKGRTLSHDDIEHYQKMTEAISQTLRLMKEVDEVISSWPICSKSPS